MRLATTLLAGAACTQAVNIQLYSAAQLNAEAEFFGAVFDWVGGAVEDIGEWTVGAIEDIGSWTGGAFEDAFEWSVGAFEDTIDFAVDAVEWTGGAIEDAVEWTGGAIVDAVEWTGNAFEDAAEWTENAIIDAGQWTGNAIIDAVEWTGDAFEDAAEWTLGAVEDFGEWTVDAIIDIGEWTANAAVDVWDWVKEGENWAAFGQTLLEGFGSAITFKFDQAGKIFSDERRWSGDGRDEIAEEKEKMDKIEKFIKELPGKCIDYMTNVEINELEKSDNFTAAVDDLLEKKYEIKEENYNKQVEEINKNQTEEYEQLKAKRDAERKFYMKTMENRAGYCATEEESLGHVFNVPVKQWGSTFYMPMTKTQEFSYNLKKYANFVWNRILDPEQINREECEANDCLHRCSGTDLFADCALCADNILENAPFRTKKALNKVKEVCSRCQYPPKQDPAMPEPLSPYVPPTIKPIQTFEAFKEENQAEAEAIHQARIDKAMNNLTPEQRQKMEEREAADEKFEALCYKEVEEFRNWEDPRNEEL